MTDLRSRPKLGVQIESYKQQISIEKMERKDAIQ